MAENDPLNALPNPEPARPRVEPIPITREELHCEFCECTLTPRGHAMELSAKARKFRDGAETIGKLEAQIARLESELTATRSQLAEAQGTKRSRGIFE